MEGPKSRHLYEDQNNKDPCRKLSKSNHVHLKQKLLRKRRRAYGSFWSRRVNQKSFTLTIPWNFANPVKIFPKIIVRQRHTDRIQMTFLRERIDLRKRLKDRSDSPAETRGDVPRISQSSRKRRNLSSSHLPTNGVYQLHPQQNRRKKKLL